jgi:type 1 glutamine amidotransferase
MTKVLSLFGGWPGHHPQEISAWADALYEELGYEVDRSSDIFTLDRDLTGYDLIVIGWNNALTTEDLTDAQEDRLLEAVESGTGLAAWHGASAAFRASLRYRFLLGGDFIEHPAGEAYPQPYTVRMAGSGHPVADGVEDFAVASEQYYMHVNPTTSCSRRPPSPASTCRGSTGTPRRWPGCASGARVGSFTTPSDTRRSISMSRTCGG